MHSKIHARILVTPISKRMSVQLSVLRMRGLPCGYSWIRHGHPLFYGYPRAFRQGRSDHGKFDLRYVRGGGTRALEDPPRQGDFGFGTPLILLMQEPITHLQLRNPKLSSIQSKSCSFKSFSMACKDWISVNKVFLSNERCIKIRFPSNQLNCTICRNYVNRASSEPSESGKWGPRRQPLAPMEAP